jgi:hypothetical protein
MHLKNRILVQDRGGAEFFQDNLRWILVSFDTCPNFHYNRVSFFKSRMGMEQPGEPGGVFSQARWLA